MAAKKDVVVDNNAIEDAKVTPVEEPKAEQESTEVAKTEKKEGFIKKSWNSYKAEMKAHPVKTTLKTVAIPAAFIGGVFAGKKIYGSEVVEDVIDTYADVVEDVVDEVTTE